MKKEKQSDRDRILENIILKDINEMTLYKEKFKKVKNNFKFKYNGKVDVGVERARINAKLDSRNEISRTKEYGIFISNFIGTTIIATILSVLFSSEYNKNKLIVMVIFLILEGGLAIFIKREIDKFQRDIYGYNEEIQYYHIALEVLNEIEKEQVNEVS